MIDDAERASLHEALDRLLDAAPDIEAIDGSDVRAEARRRIESHMHIRKTLAFARRIVGKRLPKISVTPERGGNLTAAGSMLDLASVFFGQIEGAPTIPEVAFELKAIDAGELPRSIVSKPRSRRTPTNVYRRWHGQLSALAWEVRLAQLGFSTHERQELVREAYSHEWRSIAGWQSGVRAGLGDFAVDMAFYFARINAAGLMPISGEDRMELLAALAADGLAYRTDNEIAAGKVSLK